MLTEEMKVKDEAMDEVFTKKGGKAFSTY